MHPQENPEPPIPSQVNQNRPMIFKWKAFAFRVSALLVVFLALSFKITDTRYYSLKSLKSIILSRPLRPPLHRLSQFFSTTQQKRETLKPISTFPYCVLWMAPFLSGGGYSSEAWSYVTALDENSENPRIRLMIEQHGDQETLEFWNGLPEKTKNLAYKLYNTKCMLNETIVICHSEPGAWYPPLFQTLPCPPTGYEEPMFVIGRTMFETDRLNPEHTKRCNQMDSIWVPTDFHVSTFVQSGVEPSKVLKVVQPVDVKFFDPSKYKPLDLLSAKPILGSGIQNERKEFVFLSVFKWEYRKGWDVLLRSYLKEFSKSDGVGLYLLTNPYHSDRDFGSKIMKFVEDSGIVESVNGWAPVYVIDTHVAQVDLPRLYKSANAFVLPTRGEGWGRPIVEAMAMSVPVIATNWSGPTEYLTEENGYPLPVDRMSKVTEGPFEGHLWAEPSVDKLRVLMRHVVNNPEEARRKGMKAREDMIRRFSPEVVAGLVVDQILKISKTIDIS
ncbi:UDP-Glycosyltransferase superfamily protein [Tasmannia lanceolata]|uniref:UDP-Glycosyltransferase superfamily protein n=1 Tax=Tasmannia lanceolata TaxID=3420 RepID=UPI00406365B4